MLPQVPRLSDTLVQAVLRREPLGVNVGVKMKRGAGLTSPPAARPAHTRAPHRASF